MNHMQDWNAYRDALMGRVGDFAKLSPDVVRGLQTMENSAVRTGRLEPKVHELIALAVAVTTRCDGCISVTRRRPWNSAPRRRRSLKPSAWRSR
jgi:alkylhydroperoxidase/carboxymuconolactone decarboxylase family protein YurZ